MSWVKIDDQFHTSEKALDCSLAARGLWVMCLSWVGDKETDGAVPRSVVRLHGGAEWDQLSAELVSAGLWEKTESGFQFHDYLHYNRSKAELEEERTKAAERKAAWKQRNARTQNDGTPTERRSASVPNGDGTKHPDPVPDTRIPESSTLGEKSLPVEIQAAPEEPLPPPPSSPDDAELKSSHPEERRLYEAFRSVRFPRSIPGDWERGEWQRDLPYLRQMAQRGIELAEVKRRTQVAIDRRWPSVTLKAVWNGWGDLGEDLPARPKDDPPPTSGESDSRSRIAGMLNSMAERHLAGGFQA